LICDTICLWQSVPPGCKCRRHNPAPRRGQEKVCEECDGKFYAFRSDSRFCSTLCWSRHYGRENRDKENERRRMWVADNREKRREILQRNQEKHGERYRTEKRRRYAALMDDPAQAAVHKELEHQRYEAQKGDRKRSTRTRKAHLVNDLYNTQDGKCYLCGDPLDLENRRKVHLDHDHSCCPLGSGCWICRRGLACDRCNFLIGWADDDPQRLRRIADNLEKAQEGVHRRMDEADRQPD
jgi:hypothetical protein